MKVTFIPIVSDALGTITEGLIKGKEDLEIRGRLETIHYCIIVIGKNIEKSPGDLKRLAVIQTPVKDHHR